MSIRIRSFSAPTLATTCASALLTLAAESAAFGAAAAPAAPTPISIAQIPLTIPIPAHPQILFAVDNSESMDGNLSGAIMTGSGMLGAAYAGLNATSSPINFTIPVGFTPPLNAGANGLAPYTVVVNGNQVDNSPSRLNVAKAGMQAVLNKYIPVVDFALMNFNGGTPGLYPTMVYEMSPPTSDFTFTNTQGPSEQVPNPCYQIPQDNANPVDSSCLSLAGRYGSATLSGNQYMNVGASSDDPDVNDILYGGNAGICTANNGPPTLLNNTLSGYEAGGVASIYPAGCYTWTGPTNAGYVPESPDVMYIQRGWGYYSGMSPNTGNLLVNMTSAGAVPTQTSVNTALAAFAPYLAPETSNPNTVEIKSQTVQTPLAGLMAGALSFWNTHPASSNGCAATRYVVLLTDGLPTLDLSGNNWPPLGTVSAGWYGVTATFNANGSLGSTNDQALTDTINQITALANAGIKTYVIGVGAGVDPALNGVAAQTLTAMAVAGGTSNYFPATSAAQLTTDMQVILSQVLAATQSTASTSVNSTGLHKGAYAYLAQFTTSDTYQDWTGDFLAYPINATNGTVNTSPGSAAWSAKVQLDLQPWDVGRLIATWDPVAGAGTPFRWNPGLAPAGISSGSTLGQQLSTFTPDTNGQDVLQFLRGANAQELRNGGQFRNRTHKLGDIVSSSPLYVGAPQGYYQTASYLQFEANHASRAPILYIGANDGMLHAIDAATGNERFAYVPNGVFTDLVSLANPYYNEQHQFFVNGSPQAADVQWSTDQSWHTVLLGTEGAGGKTLFALDISSADQITNETQLAQIALWEFSDPDMGYSFSDPDIGNTSDGWLVFVGNGYDSQQGKPFLYAINPQTGALVDKIDLCAAVAGACNLAVTNGLSSVTLVNSYGENTLPADTVFAGDLQGNIWRVDVSNSNPQNWVVSVVFQARDSSGNPQPITTAPAVSLNPHYPRISGDMVFVGTGQLVSLADLASTQVQTLYGVYSAPTGATPPIGFSGIPTRANLVQQTLSNATISGTQVQVESNVQPVNIPTNRGWFIDFSLASGERFVTDPQVEPGGAVIATTYQPNPNTCLGGGSAWLMAINYANGGSFPLPELDINGDGQLNSSDQVNGLNPVGMALGSVFASAPTILSTSSSQVGAVKLTAESNTTITSVNDRGRASRRIGWWEVRH